MLNGEKTSPEVRGSTLSKVFKITCIVMRPKLALRHVDYDFIGKLSFVMCFRLLKESIEHLALLSNIISEASC